MTRTFGLAWRVRAKDRAEEQDEQADEGGFHGEMSLLNRAHRPDSDKISERREAAANERNLVFSTQVETFTP